MENLWGIFKKKSKDIFKDASENKVVNYHKRPSTVIVNKGLVSGLLTLYDLDERISSVWPKF